MVSDMAPNARSHDAISCTQLLTNSRIAKLSLCIMVLKSHMIQISSCELAFIDNILIVKIFLFVFCLRLRGWPQTAL